MIITLGYIGEKKEREALRTAFRDLAAKLTDRDWNIQIFSHTGEADAYLAGEPLVNLACCDATEQGALEWVGRLRKMYRECRILLVADSKVSPLQYLRPQIMASSLLLKPYSSKELYLVLEEFIRAYLEETPDESKSLIIKTREGRVVIPYERIYYLEVREKKVYVRLLKEEYAFYATLEGLLDILPEQFVRSHRGFIINKKRIQQVRLSDNLVILQDGFQIPLSRSYKAEIKEFLA